MEVSLQDRKGESTGRKWRWKQRLDWWIYKARTPRILGNHWKLREVWDAFSLGDSGRNQPWWCSHFRHPAFSNCERINFCCFKPPRVWSFVTAPLENEHNWENFSSSFPNLHSRVIMTAIIIIKCFLGKSNDMPRTLIASSPTRGYVLLSPILQIMKVRHRKLRNLLKDKWRVSDRTRI